MGIFSWILLVVGLLIAVNVARSVLESRRLAAERREYFELQSKYGSKASEHCPHRFIQFGQTGIPGVATMTTKWCRICGKHLGPARLKESIFGNRWE